VTEKYLCDRKIRIVAKMPLLSITHILFPEEKINERESIT
jgi:hypothetical protein